MSDCAVCFAEGKEPDAWLDAKGILELFLVCKKHKLELEKEIPMAVCSCGNQDLEYKSGISKKTGKKWQGYKCTPCDLMMGMDGKPWGAISAKPSFGNSAPAPSNTLEKKVDKILAILETHYGKTVKVEDEETPF